MKHLIAILFVAAAVLPACKSSRSGERQVRAEAPDAEAKLFISPDDHRYVEGGHNREVIYFSQEKDRTYIVDEESGRILKTYEGSMPEVEVIDEMGCGCGEEEMKKKSGCGG